MRSSEDWIIGGDIYKLNISIPAPKIKMKIKIRRYVVGQKLKEGEMITAITLNALDSGKKEGRISIQYKDGYIYPAKECSRAYATLCVQGIILSAEQQQSLCTKFNEFIEKKREETHSLFLPQFRESKEYARKRIPFELAYTIVLHLISIHL